MNSGQKEQVWWRRLVRDSPVVECVIRHLMINYDISYNMGANRPVFRAAD